MTGRTLGQASAQQSAELAETRMLQDSNRHLA